MQCKDRVALVTGAAGEGVGRSIALTLAREGAKVVVSYRTSATAAKALVKSIKERGGQAVGMQADLSTAAGCQQLVERAQRHFGPIEICVVAPEASVPPELLEGFGAGVVLEDVEQALVPLFHLLPLVLPPMLAQGWGRVIGLALDLHRPSPTYIYNSGKAARIQAMILAQAPRWRNGITLNVIAPGPVAALGSLEEALAHCDWEESWHARPTLSPQDVAEGAAFLCSDAGRFITGCIMPYTSAEAIPSPASRQR
jgi:3-oxoacyl-[acyl-carrier protein] reductase